MVPTGFPLERELIAASAAPARASGPADYAAPGPVRLRGPLTLLEVFSNGWQPLGAAGGFPAADQIDYFRAHGNQATGRFRTILVVIDLIADRRFHERHLGS
jgi:hypothetical protein